MYTDWTDTSGTVLKPLKIDLNLQKSIIPDDTRLPGLDLSLPPSSLSLSVFLCLLPPLSLSPSLFFIFLYTCILYTLQYFVISFLFEYV